MSSIYGIRPLRYRAIWISDVHLGTKDCKAEFLLDFLQSTESQYLYLVGDIIDFWAMQRSLHWPQAHNDVIRTILGKAKRGTQIIYIPGNHDHPLRDYDGMDFGNVCIRNEHIHRTADGRRLLLLHGDQFDSVISCGKLVTSIGTHAYDVLLYLNRWINRFRRKLGLPYWSFAAYLKQRVKGATKHVRTFEQAVSHQASLRKVDGLVCGHIHHAEINELNDVLYCNDGDWVENCTALVETHAGSLQLLHWADERQTVKSHPLGDYDATDQIA